MYQPTLIEETSLVKLRKISTKETSMLVNKMHSNGSGKDRKE
jgi:hypothetical protein